MVEEVPAAAHSSIGRVAAISESHAERDMHRVASACGVTLPVEMSHIAAAEGERIPFFSISSWFRFLLRFNLWHVISGVSSPDMSACCRKWGVFWERFRIVCGGHPVFARGKAALQRTCAMILHGDEGRSLKKTQLMVLALHSIMGFGSRVESDEAAHPDRQELNMQVHTWASRYLLAVLPRFMYDDRRDGNFQTVLAEISRDGNHLFEEGILGPDNQVYYVCILYVIGDWPQQQKMFNYQRSFSNSAKASSSRQALKGICHHCLADVAGYPFEDFKSAEPRWRSTVDTVPAYDEEPVLMQLPHDPAKPSSFAAPDLFHGWHLGIGKIFVSSCLVLLLHLFPANSVVASFQAMQDAFFEFCKNAHLHPHIRKLNRDTLNWPYATTFPTGGWNKGHTTLCLMRFFIHHCQNNMDAVGTDPLLEKALEAALEIHLCLTKLYKEGLWVFRPKAREIYLHGFRFLELFGELAHDSFEVSRPLFSLMPNLHRIHHIFFHMADQVRAGATWVLSPLTWSCQVEEDFVGRPSRVSRRVSPRSTMRRTLQRCMQAAYAKYVEYGYLRPAPQTH